MRSSCRRGLSFGPAALTHPKREPAFNVFLLSQTCEAYAATGDTKAAVGAGVQRTGRLVSAAGLVFATTMAVLASSSLTLLKVIGVGLGVATLVRSGCSSVPPGIG
ncbi:MMPL family transporter [Streptomyces sp. NPDC102467]|uniref:MMPL family transporter n=1 Tax=Streptomyces sp. NPDC102467 TaxID=3366179 RepID=UPI00382713BC